MTSFCITLLHSFFKLFFIAAQVQLSAFPHHHHHSPLPSHPHSPHLIILNKASHTGLISIPWAYQVYSHLYIFAVSSAVSFFALLVPSCHSGFSSNAYIVEVHLWNQVSLWYKLSEMIFLFACLCIYFVTPLKCTLKYKLHKSWDNWFFVVVFMESPGLRTLP